MYPIITYQASFSATYKLMGHKCREWWNVAGGCRMQGLGAFGGCATVDFQIHTRLSRGRGG